MTGLLAQKKMKFAISLGSIKRWKVIFSFTAFNIVSSCLMCCKNVSVSVKPGLMQQVWMLVPIKSWQVAFIMPARACFEMT